MTRYAHRPLLELRFRWMPRCASRTLTATGWSGCCATHARPPFALERLEPVAYNQLVYRFPKPPPDAAFITHTPAANTILGHLGEPTTPPAVARARGPLMWDPKPESLANAADTPAPVPEFVFDQPLGC